MIKLEAKLIVEYSTKDEKIKLINSKFIINVWKSNSQMKIK